MWSSFVCSGIEFRGFVPTWFMIGCWDALHRASLCLRRPWRPWKIWFPRPKSSRRSGKSLPQVVPECATGRELPMVPTVFFKTWSSSEQYIRNQVKFENRRQVSKARAKLRLAESLAVVCHSMVCNEPFWSLKIWTPKNCHHRVFVRAGLAVQSTETSGHHHDGCHGNDGSAEAYHKISGAPRCGSESGHGFLPSWLLQVPVTSIPPEFFGGPEISKQVYS